MEDVKTMRKKHAEEWLVQRASKSGGLAVVVERFELSKPRYSPILAAWGAKNTHTDQLWRRALARQTVWSWGAERAMDGGGEDLYMLITAIVDWERGGATFCWLLAL
jgi:hypothetical protein